MCNPRLQGEQPREERPLAEALAALPRVQLDVQHSLPTRGPQAQQLFDELLQQLGQAAGQREEADREEEEVAQRCQQACEQAWQREQRLRDAQRRAHREERAQRQQERACTPCQAAPQAKAAQHGCRARASGPDPHASGTGLDRLREAAWQAAHDPEGATQALLTAWVGAGLTEVEGGFLLHASGQG